MGIRTFIVLSHQKEWPQSTLRIASIYYDFISKRYAWALTTACMAPYMQIVVEGSIRLLS